MIDNENKKILTDEELDKVVEAATESRVNNPTDNVDVSVNEDAELEEVDIQVPITHSTADMIAAMSPEKDEIDEIAEIYEKQMDNAKVTPLSDEEIENLEKKSNELAAKAAKNNFDLNEDEAMAVLDAINALRKDPKASVYKLLPPSIKNIVHDLAFKNNIPFSGYNMIARELLNEFMSDASVDAAFVDLEEALDEALKIPSIVDLYTEHTMSVMNENIPKIIEEIKDTEPEKAEKLAKVRESFQKAYTFAFAKEEYENKGIVRKAVRKYERELTTCLENYNFRNSKNNFKMNDATELPLVLAQILIEEPELVVTSYTEDGKEIPERFKKVYDMNITDVDIAKFCIAICKPCDTLDPHNIIDASYMYYLVKNIITLKHTKEAKTEFAAELINNICEFIAFIRTKEAEFYAANNNESKQTKKRNKSGNK